VEAPADSAPTTAPAADAPADEPAAESMAEEPSAQEAAAEAPAEESASSDATDLIAGRPASGIDPDTGLEINPATITPGVDYILRAELISASLTPQDSPEFMLTSPAGVRYRVRAQPVPEIKYEDGTQPALHEFTRGMLVQATVRQEEGAGATILVHSTDLTLLQNAE
jgi:hypothetical protein